MKKLGLFSAWIILCALLGYYAPTLPIVKDIVAIKKVNVVGTDKLSENDLKNIFKTENWIFVSEDRLKEKLKKYQFIKDIKILKPNLGEITMVVEEKKPFANIIQGSKVFTVDEEGNLYETDISNLLNLVNIYYNDSEFQKSDVLKIKKIMENFKDYQLSKFIIQKSQIAAETGDGKILVFSKDELDDSINKAKIFLANKNLNDYTYLNFSFDEMVIVKKSNEEMK
jgi:cell division protein FtsQ